MALHRPMTRGLNFPPRSSIGLSGRPKAVADILSDIGSADPASGGQSREAP